MKTHQNYLYKIQICFFSSVVLKTELYTSRLVNPTMQLNSRLILKDDLNEKIFFSFDNIKFKCFL